MGPRTDFLFAQPSLLSGAARVMDVGSVFTGYNKSVNGFIADTRALRLDWLMVGADLLHAMLQIELEVPQAARPPAHPPAEASQLPLFA